VLLEHHESHAASAFFPLPYQELVGFLRENKKWWIAPIALSILLLGVLVVLGGTAAAPFTTRCFESRRTARIGRGAPQATCEWNDSSGFDRARRPLRGLARTPMPSGSVSSHGEQESGIMAAQWF
jgi:hypothetical protein